MFFFLSTSRRRLGLCFSHDITRKKKQRGFFASFSPPLSKTLPRPRRTSCVSLEVVCKR